MLKVVGCIERLDNNDNANNRRRRIRHIRGAVHTPWPAALTEVDAVWGGEKARARAGLTPKKGEPLEGKGLLTHRGPHLLEAGRADCTAEHSLERTCTHIHTSRLERGGTEDPLTTSETPTGRAIGYMSRDPATGGRHRIYSRWNNQSNWGRCKNRTRQGNRTAKSAQSSTM